MQSQPSPNPWCICNANYCYHSCYFRQYYVTYIYVYMCIYLKQKGGKQLQRMLLTKGESFSFWQMNKLAAKLGFGLGYVSPQGFRYFCTFDDLQNSPCDEGGRSGLKVPTDRALVPELAQDARARLFRKLSSQAMVEATSVCFNACRSQVVPLVPRTRRQTWFGAFRPNWIRENIPTTNPELTAIKSTKSFAKKTSHVMCL